LYGVWVLRIIFLLAVLLIVLGVVGAFVAYFILTPTTTLSPGTTSTPTTTSVSPGQPRVSNITSEGFVIVEDSEVCWRVRIYGEVDLRNITTINGVTGHWFGRINVTHPAGNEILLFEVGDYVNVFTQFSYLSGSKVLDACVLYWTWEGEIWPEGTYEVILWLYHSPGIYTTLFEKTFNLKMNFEVNITPTTWDQWNETLKLTIKNTGDVPLFVGAGDIYLVSNPDVLIGWWGGQGYEVILPKQTKELAEPVLIRSDYVEYLSGKTATVRITILTTNITINVSFPA